MSDISTTSASVAQILGLRALYGFGMIEISGGFTQRCKPAATCG